MHHQFVPGQNSPTAVDISDLPLPQGRFITDTIDTCVTFGSSH